jgi:UDP-glucose 4-epimerase
MEEVIIGDIRDETTLTDLSEKQFDVVIHLISLDHHKSEANPNLVSSINVIPTWDLLDRFTKHGLNKFIYFSTIQVYGKIPNKTIYDDYDPSPINAYGLTHLLSEKICNYYNARTETDCINVRLSNSYGSPVFTENNCWWLVINDFCKTAFEQGKIKLLSDGSPQRDFIHISDICGALELLINVDKKDLRKNTYHISSGETLTILDIAFIVKRVFQKRSNLDIQVKSSDNSILKNPDRHLHSQKYTVSNSMLNSLGFTPVTSLETGINEIFDYLEEN